jgi:hypothetical protein
MGAIDDTRGRANGAVDKVAEQVTGDCPRRATGK